MAQTKGTYNGENTKPEYKEQKTWNRAASLVSFPNRQISSDNARLNDDFGFDGLNLHNPDKRRQS
jgi:hypothetical protein